MTYFEKVREEIIDTKIKSSTKIAAIFVVINFILLYFALTTGRLFIVFFIASVLFTARQVKIIESGKRYKEDIKITPLYDQIMRYDRPYYEIVQELSEEMQGDCINENNGVYITKNWIIDFSDVNIKIINYDEIAWMYAVNIHATQHIQCHLYDSTEHMFPVRNANKGILFIRQQRPNIFTGYSNKIETLMLKDKNEFIQNIKNGIYPTVEGTWQSK